MDQQNLLGEMWGENAIQARFCLVLAGAKTVDGFERTKLGGVVLGKMCTSRSWERWMGTIILIPDSIDHATKGISAHPLETVMVSDMRHNQLWRPKWKLHSGEG